MSQPAVSWVIEHSPYEGAFFLLHIVVADTVDGQEELRVSHRWLSARAKVNRRTAADFLHRAVKDGYLEPVGAGPNRMTNYRLVVGGPVPTPPGGALTTPLSGALTTPPGGAAVVQRWCAGGAEVVQSLHQSGARVVQSVPNTSSSFTSTSPAVARTRVREAPAAVASEQRRDGSTEEEEPKDPLATRLADGLEHVAYDQAATVVAELRDEGISDTLIDEAVGKAIEAGARQANYVRTVAHDWMRQRCPGWRSASKKPSGLFGGADYRAVIRPSTVDTTAIDLDTIEATPPPKPLREALAAAVPFGMDLPPADHQDLCVENTYSQKPAPGQVHLPRRDRLADELYMLIEGAGYDDALGAVEQLREAGVPDAVVRMAVAGAADAGGATLDYVAAVATNLASGRNGHHAVDQPASNGGAA